jgi:CRISPR/Cas system-associated endonuclease/helicase Cas3
VSAEVIDLQAYNPYPSFQPGQAEAIQQMLDLHESGAKVVELNAPTAAGKSLDLFVLGRILTEGIAYPVGRVVYTTPLVALVNQLQDTKAFEKMPVLKGKRNYPCGFLRTNPDLSGWQTDAEFGHSLAKQILQGRTLSSKQTASAAKMLKTYRGQLLKAGITPEAWTR